MEDRSGLDWQVGELICMEVASVVWVWSVALCAAQNYFVLHFEQLFMNNLGQFRHLFIFNSMTFGVVQLIGNLGFISIGNSMIWC